MVYNGKLFNIVIYVFTWINNYILHSNDLYTYQTLERRYKCLFIYSCFIRDRVKFANINNARDN